MDARFNCAAQNGTITITQYRGCGGVVAIPATVEGLPVTSIGSNAFYRCRSLTSVVIPDGITRIGHNAFWACTGLTSVMIPDTVTSIEGGAFLGCPNLGRVVIGKGVSSIGYGAFGCCASLPRLTLPVSVTSIGGSAFGSCTNLTGLYFKGDAPNRGCPVVFVFSSDVPATVYYLPGTTGWGATFGGRPTAKWIP